MTKVSCMHGADQQKISCIGSFIGGNDHSDVWSQSRRPAVSHNCIQSTEKWKVSCLGSSKKEVHEILEIEAGIRGFYERYRWLIIQTIMPYEILNWVPMFNSRNPQLNAQVQQSKSSIECPSSTVEILNWMPKFNIRNPYIECVTLRQLSIHGYWSEFWWPDALPGVNQLRIGEDTVESGNLFNGSWIPASDPTSSTNADFSSVWRWMIILSGWLCGTCKLCDTCVDCLASTYVRAQPGCVAYVRAQPGCVAYVRVVWHMCWLLCWTPLLENPTDQRHFLYLKPHPYPISHLYPNLIRKFWQTYL